MRIRNARAHNERGRGGSDRKRSHSHANQFQDGNMNAAVAIVLAIVLVAFSEVACYSGGAPSQACDNLTPSHGPQPQATSVPYSIDLAPLTGTSGGVGYTPGQTYTRKPVHVSLSRLDRVRHYTITVFLEPGIILI